MSNYAFNLDDALLQFKTDTEKLHADAIKHQKKMRIIRRIQIGAIVVGLAGAFVEGMANAHQK